MSPGKSLFPAVLEKFNGGQKHQPRFTGGPDENPPCVIAVTFLSDFGSDGPVKPGRHEDGESRPRREEAETSLPRAVIFLRFTQQLAQGDTDEIDRRFIRLADMGKTHTRNLVKRKVETAPLRIFPHVAGDVCELHRDAQINRVGKSPPVGYAHDLGHKKPDRSGHLITVAVQGSPVLKPHLAGVGFESVEKVADDLTTEVMLFHQSGKLPHSRRNLTRAAFEHSSHRLDPGDCDRLVACIIDEIIQVATESIQYRAILKDSGTEKTTRKMKGFAVFSEDFPTGLRRRMGK